MSVRPVGTIPAGSEITIDFPVENPEAPRGRQRAYLVGGKVECTAAANAAASLKCTVQRQGQALKLLISDAITSDIKDQTISIELKSIYNPLSM